jgi:hypothetical protein
MWYREAAFGTIDLQKYTSESVGEDFDFENELDSIIESGIDTRNGRIYFHLLNKKLQTSKLKQFISEFNPIYKSNSIATFEPSTKIVGLRDLKPGETLEDLAQSIRHELRHSVDKARTFREDHISTFAIDLAINFFKKYNDALFDPITKELNYDQEKMLSIMSNDYLSTKFGDEFKSNSNSYKSAVIRQFLDQVIKRADQAYQVLQKLAKGESQDDVFSYFYINNPQEYSTLLSDIADYYSPLVFQKYAEQFSSMNKQTIINEIKSAISNPYSSSATRILQNISSEGEYLISKILKHTDNEQMRRNVYKIIYEKFQEFANRYLNQPDEFKTEE